MIQKEFIHKIEIDGKPLYCTGYYNYNSPIDAFLQVKYNGYDYSFQIKTSHDLYSVKQSQIQITPTCNEKVLPLMYLHSYLLITDIMDEFFYPSDFFRAMYYIIRQELIRGYGV